MPRRPPSDEDLAVVKERLRRATTLRVEPTISTRELRQLVARAEEAVHMQNTLEAIGRLDSPQGAHGPGRDTHHLVRSIASIARDTLAYLGIAPRGPGDGAPPGPNAPTPSGGPNERGILS